MSSLSANEWGVVFSFLDTTTCEMVCEVFPKDAEEAWRTNTFVVLYPNMLVCESMFFSSKELALAKVQKLNDKTIDAMLLNFYKWMMDGTPTYERLSVK